MPSYRRTGSSNMASPASSIKAFPMLAWATASSVSAPVHSDCTRPTTSSRPLKSSTGRKESTTSRPDSNSRRSKQNLIDYGNVAGSWNFYNNMTSIGNANTATYPGLMTANAETGFGPATMLLGIVNGVSMAPAVVPYQYRWKYYAGFLQDDFKISPRLKLNLGVR